jgi:hypothetical protein
VYTASNLSRAVQVEFASGRRRSAFTYNAEARHRPANHILKGVPPGIDAGPKSVAANFMIVLFFVGD